jgi:hypothetical protein
MTLKLIVCSLSLSFGVICQTNPNQKDLRGPVNILSGGVIDGVVLKEELPIRSKIDYEHVREADYVWSKRVFSRIDQREKINHVLFFPLDFINQDEYSLPKVREEVEQNKFWLRHQERLSLWTVIEKHLLLGDLTAYYVRSEDTPLNEDGYQFKYPLIKSSNDDFFTNSKYRDELSRLITFGKKGTFWTIPNPNNNGNPMAVKKGTNPNFQAWIDSLTIMTPTSAVEPQDANSSLTIWDQLGIVASDPEQRKKLEDAWNEAKNNSILKSPPELRYITSSSICAYNIKEDWFFDKERSILDRRIIAIAPVAKYLYSDSSGQGDPLDRFDAFVFVDVNGEYKVLKQEVDPATKTNTTVLKQIESSDGTIIEKEMFWLYFPELRDVIVNYYTFNDNSDSQWMSFDDLFWKRKFSATIYKVSDKFDREIEDYKYGVDALYEAERIKDDIRTWEIDVWNY